jgi:hypothetical protein
MDGVRSRENYRHPKHPALEWMELLVPDQRAVTVENGTDRILTLTPENGVGLLQLSLASQLYQPGMLAATSNGDG